MTCSSTPAPLSIGLLFFRLYCILTLRFPVVQHIMAWARRCSKPAARPRAKQAQLSTVIATSLFETGGDQVQDMEQGPFEEDIKKKGGREREVEKDGLKPPQCFRHIT